MLFRKTLIRKIRNSFLEFVELLPTMVERECEQESEVVCGIIVCSQKTEKMRSEAKL